MAGYLLPAALTRGVRKLVAIVIASGGSDSPKW
jgi:hypothetical protein